MRGILTRPLNWSRPARSSRLVRSSPPPPWQIAQPPDGLETHAETSFCRGPRPGACGQCGTDRDGVSAGRHRSVADRGRAAPRGLPWRYGDERRDGAGQGCRPETAGAGGGDCREITAGCAPRAGRRRRSRFYQRDAGQGGLGRGVALRPGMRRGLRPQRPRRGRKGQCRICLRQSHRSDACRPWSGRGVRRRTRHDCSEAEWLPLVRAKAVQAMLDEIRGDLAAVKVEHEVFFSERSLVEGKTDQVAATIDALRAAGFVYQGRLPPPKGQLPDDWEDREQTLFRSTAFGDDIDRPLLKSDGGYTYFASDVAYHKSKFDRGFRTLIDVWGADHGGYIKRMQAAVKAVSGGRADLDIKIVQLVRLLRGGQPVKMSKRAGEFVTLREVVGEVGSDPVRFMMLYRKNDAVLDFDLAKVIEQSRDNPVFYVQYAHARGNSVFRNAREVLPELPEGSAERSEHLGRAPVQRLDDAAELGILKRIALYPRLLDGAAAAHEPHRVAFYLYDLASEFHAQWTRGKDLPHLRFIIQDDPQLTLARLALVQGVVTVLASGLKLLGVKAPEEMR